MSQTKNMHFVPKTYLKRFAIEEMKAGTKQYYVYAMDNGLKKQIGRRNISRICYEKSLYELPGTNSEEQLLIENMYRELYENGYKVLYDLMIDPARTTITAEERYKIVAFVVSLFYRNTIWNYAFNSLMDQTLAKVYHMTQEDKQQSFFLGKEEVSIAGKTLDELKSEHRKKDRPMIAAVNTQAIFALTRLRYRSDFITIMKAQPGYEFVTSDNPVICKNDGKGRLIPFDEKNSLWLPIDKYHLLQVESWAHQLDWTIIGRLSEPIPGLITSMNNHYQVVGSTEYVLGNESSLTAVKKSPYGIMKHAMKRAEKQISSNL
jgi:hypothetical protein